MQAAAIGWQKRAPTGSRTGCGANKARSAFWLLGTGFLSLRVRLAKKCRTLSERRRRRRSRQKQKKKKTTTTVTRGREEKKGGGEELVGRYRGALGRESSSRNYSGSGSAGFPSQCLAREGRDQWPQDPRNTAAADGRSGVVGGKTFFFHTDRRGEEEVRYQKRDQSPVQEREP